MRKLRKRIVSVLLFCVSFLVVHDYVIDSLASKQESQKVFQAYEMSDTKKSKDIVLQVHDNIHTLLAHNMKDKILSSLVRVKKVPFIQKHDISTHIPFVLERPPIA